MVVRNEGNVCLGAPIAHDLALRSVGNGRLASFRPVSAVSSILLSRDVAEHSQEGRHEDQIWYRGVGLWWPGQRSVSDRLAEVRHSCLDEWLIETSLMVCGIL